MSKIELIHGDCVDIMRGLPDASVDSIVTDPPAGIAFMGKAWDKDHGGRDAWIANMTTIAAECLRVLKPGGHALVWALPRTSHWTATAWENAGFEVRDRVAHVFGSGFPKSHNVSKAIDKAAGAEREVVRVRTDGNKCGGANTYDDDAYIWDKSFAETAPATPEAARWDGWGTALKPAMEDWWLLRKPLRGTVAANVLAWGTGAINVDGCRVGTEPPAPRNAPKKIMRGGKFHAAAEAESEMSHFNPTQGRWPANVIHDGSDEVVGLFPVTKNGGQNESSVKGRGMFMNGASTGTSNYAGDIGSAARFFYCAKASKADRNSGLDGTCTVKYNIDKSNLILSGGLSWKDVYTVLVQSLQKVTSESTLQWSIGESGESITGLCPLDSLSTTLTEISRITTSEILNLLTPSLINAFTPVVNFAMVNGGSPAGSAGNSNGYQQTTTNGHLESARGVSCVVSKMLSVISDGENWKPRTNIHSTVKPTDLMRWLVRLVTPPGGVVLDPFCGSGSTGKAAALEGMQFIGIDMDAEYLEIARRRTSVEQEQLSLWHAE